MPPPAAPPAPPPPPPPEPSPGLTPSGYWPSPWPCEDGGPRRLGTVPGTAGPVSGTGATPEVTFTEAIASTMVVLREPGEVFVLRHGIGAVADAWVERIHPVTLEVQQRSPDLPGGRVWPGGLAAHADGTLPVVFGRHAHLLSADLEVLASAELPRDRPYNSFVVLADGAIATKDFGGLLPGDDPATTLAEPAELLVLDPHALSVRASLVLPEPSIARLSAAPASGDGGAPADPGAAGGDDIYVVGTHSLMRVRWDGAALTLDEGFRARYRTIEGQTHGWDPVLALGAAWFLDNGGGSERYIGTFRGQGVSVAPLHLVRVDLGTGAVSLTEACGLPDGVIANPPLIDEARRIAVAYDSGNGVLAAFDIAGDGSTSPRWRRDQDHACHPLLFAGTGALVTNDHDASRMADQLVVLDITTGAEWARVDSGSPVQSVLFMAPGWHDDLYSCSFAGISRLSAGSVT